jgi:hypothetical protein
VVVETMFFIFFVFVFRSFVRGVLLFLTNCHLEMMINFLFFYCLCMRITNQNTTTASYYAPLSLSIKRNNKWGTCMEMKEIEPKTHNYIVTVVCVIIIIIYDALVSVLYNKKIKF